VPVPLSGSSGLWKTRAMPARWTGFERRLGVVALCALAIRTFYVLVLERDLSGPGDFYFYHWSANLLAEGKGYIEPFSLVYQGITQPTAFHPPAWPFLLSIVSWMGGSGAPVGHIGGHDYVAHRLTGTVCGTLVVVLLGYLGRRVGGDRVGIVAAAIAAFYPILIADDGSLLSESLYGVFISGTLLLGYRLIDKPTPGRALALGAAIGVAALTRAEAWLLLLLLVVPLVGFPRRWVPRRVSPRLVGVAAAGMVVVIFPWILRDWIVFGKPAPISTGAGAVIAGANCDKAYHGKLVGFWVISCIPPRGAQSEIEYTARWQRHGLSYAEHHGGRLAVVAFIRVLRTWGLYQIGDDPGERPQALSVVAYLVILPLAVAGFFLLRRRQQPLVVLLAPVYLVTISSLTGYGTTRFRYAAELSLVVLAAVAAVYAWDRRSELPSLQARARPAVRPRRRAL
jgi:4-amino-4-deoxy-L-arabinose transferase-like glycosyltransferase